MYVYFLDILASFGADLEEEDSAQGFIEGFSFLLGNFSYIFQIKFGADKKKYGFLADIIFDFSDPNIQLFKAIFPLNRIQKQHCSNSFVSTLNNTLEGLLAHLT